MNNILHVIICCFFNFHILSRLTTEENEKDNTPETFEAKKSQILFFLVFAGIFCGSKAAEEDFCFPPTEMKLFLKPQWREFKHNKGSGGGSVG